MNYLRILSILCIGILFFASCSSDDDNGQTNNEPLAGNYFPSAATNIWTYEVDNTNDNNPEFNFTDETDFVVIETSTGNSFTLKVNNGGAPNGIMNGFLSNGTLLRGDSTLSYSGNLELPEEFDDFTDETIMLQNFKLYDLNASNNELLDEITNSVVEDLDLNGTIVPLTIEYGVSSEKISLMNSMSVSGTSYSNVIHSRFKLNMNLFVSVDILGGNNPTDYSIIENQDILVIDSYFAEDIGLIKAQAVYSYQLEQQFIDLLALIPNEIDIPESANVVNVQDLDDAQVD